MIGYTDGVDLQVLVLYISLSIRQYAVPVSLIITLRPMHPSDPDSVPQSACSSSLTMSLLVLRGSQGRRRDSSP